MDENKTATAIVLAGIGVATVVGVARYAYETRIERKKRKSIARWERENLMCIRNSTERLQKVANDPTLTLKDFVAAWNEEVAFLNIVQSQPMY